MILPSTSWIKVFNLQGHFRLFCFPYAGGGSSIFRTWQEHFPEEIAVCPVRLPGREDRLAEPPFLRLSLLVTALTHALRPYLVPPFAFFGHSMGALISFELARQCRRLGYPQPDYLFVSAQAAPQLPYFSPPIHHLPDDLFVEEIQRLKGTPQVILQHAELMQLFLPLLRADWQMYETYAYSAEKPLKCPIAAFGGSEDDVAFDMLESWRDQTVNSFSMRIFLGDHFFLKSCQHLLIDVIAQNIIDWQGKN